MSTNKLFRQLLRDEKGATAIEYSLIAALIGMAIMTALNTVNVNLSKSYEKTANSLNR